MNAETRLRATEIVLNEQLVAHEAGHCAAALLLDLSVAELQAPFHKLAGVEDRDPDEPAGQVLIEHSNDPDDLRKLAIATLCGPLEDGQPPPSWPLTALRGADDEYAFAEAVEQAGLDEAGYKALTSEALDLVATREYERLALAISHLLEQRGHLNSSELARVKALVIEGKAMEHKTLDATTVSTNTELGTFEAIVSAWGPDREHDTIERTAFDTTIAAWQGSGKHLPLLFEHSTEAVGAVDPHSMRPTGDGLLVAGEVDRSTEKGQQVWRQVKASTIGFSIGFMAKTKPRAGGGRHLLEIDLLEVSATSTPMHPAARAVSWKSANDDDREVPSLEELRARERELGLDEDHEARQLIADEFRTLLTDAMGHTNGNGTDDSKSLAALREKAAKIEREFGEVQIASFEC